MSENKSTVKTKPKLNKAQPKKAPTGKRKQRGPRKNVRLGHKYDTTLQFRNLVASDLRADTSKTTADPFDDEFTSQYAKKTDVSTFQLTAAQCVTLSKHTNELVSADSSYPIRYCWRPPLTESVQDKEDVKLVADVRGQFVGVTSVELRFTNTSPVQIKVRGNTPKAIMDQPFDVNMRTHEFTFKIPAGATRTHKITWTNGKRDSPHMTTATGEMDKDSISLLDMYVLMPDINPEANYVWQPSTTVVDVHTTVHYDVETMVMQGSVASSIKPFYLVSLGNYYNMFHVEAEVTGLFSGASRRQLTTAGDYYISEATFANSFRVGTTVNAAGTYLILHDWNNAPAPVIIQGAPQGAVIYLPVVQQGVATLKTNSKYKMSVTTGMAVNVGAVSATLDNNSPHKGYEVKGKQMWVLVTANGEALISGTVKYSAPNDSVNTQPYQFLGDALTVNYWPRWEGFAGNKLQRDASQHMREMQQIGISLMSVILVLEAVTTIINVIRGVSKAISKAN